VRKRTRARELALQMLYQVDARGPESIEDLDSFLLREEPEDAEVREFARALVVGTIEVMPSLDEILGAAAENWQIRRMATVDRNILRMAVFEMLHRPDIPAKVSINEAIDMGKRFSTQQSGSFINGILDRVRRDRNL